MFYTDATDAVSYAVAIAPCCIGYKRGSGWFTYDPKEGCPTGCEPEFFVAAAGRIPVPLTENAVGVWTSILGKVILKNK